MKRLTLEQQTSLIDWFNKSLDLAKKDNWSLDEFLAEMMYAGLEAHEELFVLRLCGHDPNFKKHYNTRKKLAY